MFNVPSLNSKVIALTPNYNINYLLRILITMTCLGRGDKVSRRREVSFQLRKQSCENVWTKDLSIFNDDNRPPEIIDVNILFLFQAQMLASSYALNTTFSSYCMQDKLHLAKRFYRTAFNSNL